MIIDRMKRTENKEFRTAAFLHFGKLLDNDSYL